MAEKKAAAGKVSTTSTKHEILEAYNALLKEVDQRKEVELAPEKMREEKRAKEVVQVADSLASEGVVRGINDLKLELGRVLSQVSDKLEEEVNKYRTIQKAIEFKEKEVKELYEIERSASTLAALIEAQNQKRQVFESEMVARKEELILDIETTRAEWEKEKKERETAAKVFDAEEKKKREREKEEFRYAFDREQQLAKDKFGDEKANLEKEIRTTRERMEKELAEREKVLAEGETELSELRKTAAALPKEMEEAVNRAVKETSQRMALEAKGREELLKKEFDGQRNVLTTRIESLEKTVADQAQHVAKLSQQLEQAYQKVQDIALKAVEGSSSFKAVAGLQQMFNDQARRQPQEK